MFNVWDSRGQLIIILLIYLERTTSCICGEVCSLIFEAEKATSSMFFGSRFAVQHWGGKDCYQVCPNDGDTQTQADYLQNLLLPVLTDWASEQNAKCSMLVYCQGLGFPINGLIQSRLVSQPTYIHTPWDSSHSRALPNTPCLHWRTTCTTAHATVNLCSSFRTFSASKNRYTGKYINTNTYINHAFIVKNVYLADVFAKSLP